MIKRNILPHNMQSMQFTVNTYTKALQKKD